MIAPSNPENMAVIAYPGMILFESDSDLYLT
jgi:hypothetical protein